MVTVWVKMSCSMMIWSIQEGHSWPLSPRYRKHELSPSMSSWRIACFMAIASLSYNSSSINESSNHSPQRIVSLIPIFLIDVLSFRSIHYSRIPCLHSCTMNPSIITTVSSWVNSRRENNKKNNTPSVLFFLSFIRLRLIFSHQLFIAYVLLP